MTKLEYLYYSIQQALYLKRGWLLSVFGILPDNTPETLQHLGVKTHNQRLSVILDPPYQGVSEAVISDYVPGQPLYDRNERVFLKAGTMRCIQADMETTYGIWVLNALLIEYPYNGLIPYINGEMTPGLIDKTAYNALKRDDVTVEMHKRFENGVSAITALAQCGVPSATRKSMTPNPEVTVLKRKLLSENQGRLNDPAVIAGIQDQLAKLDAEYLKGDPAEGFYIKNKSKMSRLRTMAMFGAEQDFINEDNFNVIENSLSEGWDIKDLPMLANAIRGGSFNRGANTALGGAETKISARIFQNYKISEEDCHVGYGMHVFINEDNYKEFQGRYLIGQEVPLTLDELKNKIGKVIEIRSPDSCVTPGTGFCKKCMGDTVVNSGVGITALMTGVTSTFLSLFLAMMHSSALSTKRYNYRNRIT